jgi:hypothetical protein
MKVSKVWIGGLAATLLAACSSSMSASPPQTQAASAATTLAKSSSLLYVSEEQYQVLVFDYRNGVVGQQLSTLENFRYPRGMCTDKNGDVWITDEYQGRVTKYLHGGTSPVETIVEGNFSANDCAVDPRTGNLAISNWHSNSGSVRIYPPKSHKATIYKSSYFEPTSLAYDNAGDLVATGGRGQLYELPYRGSQFITMSVSGGTITDPGGIQWSNPNFVIGGQSANGPAAYKVSVSNGAATIVGLLPLNGTVSLISIALRAGNAVVPDFSGDIIRTYDLSNGKVISSYSNGLVKPWGVAVSQPPP